jgi:hypothetical protein
MAAAPEANTAREKITAEALKRRLLGDFILKVYLKPPLSISGQIPKAAPF